MVTVDADAGNVARAAVSTRLSQLQHPASHSEHQTPMIHHFIRQLWSQTRLAVAGQHSVEYLLQSMLQLHAVHGAMLLGGRQSVAAVTHPCGKDSASFL